jgi:sulfopyruvate decarboxylase subunit alpha
MIESLSLLTESPVGCQINTIWLDTTADNSLEGEIAGPQQGNNGEPDSRQHRMGTIAGAQQILAGLKDAGIDLVASVPDINMLQLINLLYEDKAITHVPVGREEEGIGVCAGAHLGGKKTAMLMQNGGLLNSCNGLTTTALQFGMPILLLIYYAGDIGDNAFHMVGLVTEPVLQGLGIKYIALRDPVKVKQDIAGAVVLANSSKRPVALLLTRAVL